MIVRQTKTNKRYFFKLTLDFKYIGRQSVQLKKTAMDGWINIIKLVCLRFYSNVYYLVSFEMS